MSVTVSSLQAAFKPEYDDVDEELIQICIDEAASRVDPINARGKTDMAIRYLAGHLLDIRAAGQNSRLAPDLNETIKGREYLRIMRTYSYGSRAIISPYPYGWGVFR